MPDGQNNQQETPQAIQVAEVIQVVETIPPQTWGGEPLNTNLTAFSNKGLNPDILNVKEETSEQ